MTGDRHTEPTISLRLPRPLRERAEALAAETGTPLRRLLVDAIERGLPEDKLDALLLDISERS